MRNFQPGECGTSGSGRVTVQPIHVGGSIVTQIDAAFHSARADLVDPDVRTVVIQIFRCERADFCRIQQQVKPGCLTDLVRADEVNIRRGCVDTAVFIIVSCKLRHMDSVTFVIIDGGGNVERTVQPLRGGGTENTVEIFTQFQIVAAGEGCDAFP